MRIKTLCVFGTRPEAIKMAPLIKQLEKNSAFTNKVCVTGQHKQMLMPILNLFDITPDFNLNIMTPNQNLSHLTAKILIELCDVFSKYKPDIVFVHGDTTSNLAASLSSYYHQVSIAHVEAGLRTGNLMLPWPEEANRKLSDALADIHFAPTEHARLNLLQENVPSERIYITGNTVIDALFSMLNKLDKNPELTISMKQKFSFLTPARKMILVTGHRRESFGEAFERICQSLVIIAKRFPGVDIVYPVHLNPNVQEPVNRLLAGVNNIYLLDPVDYLPFVYLMKTAYLILTDSGGIQEEAPSLGKPVLVMREKTERPEALDAGTVRLVGTHVENIVKQVELLLTDTGVYRDMSFAQNPYGDGDAATRMVNIILDRFNPSNKLFSHLEGESSVF
jgi:UDP-N-acetylglucosamine 2-epimerase (non-hydrolysing)